MDYTPAIGDFNRSFQAVNSVSEYNKFLHGSASFDMEDTKTAFDEALERASKSHPLRDKNDPNGLGNFASQMGSAFSNSLNAVNNAKLEANRMQEDIAIGGSTNIHEAMIAAEKASLSMQMAIQVRNRLVSAYTDITSMAL